MIRRGIEREVIYRLFFKLSLIFTGLIMLSGDCDELACYLTPAWQRLLGAGLFFGAGLWLYRWSRWRIQHDFAWSKIYDRPINFNRQAVANSRPTPPRNLIRGVFLLTRIYLKNICKPFSRIFRAKNSKVEET